jgi:hypothetical protein
VKRSAPSNKQRQPTNGNKAPFPERFSKPDFRQSISPYRKYPVKVWKKYGGEILEIIQ